MKFLVRFVLIFTLLFFTGSLVKGLFYWNKSVQCELLDDDTNSEDENDTDDETKVEFEWFIQHQENSHILCQNIIEVKPHFFKERNGDLLAPNLETNHQPPECSC